MENKAQKIMEIASSKDIELKKSFAYGDYVEDYYMLNIVGNPVAVNPDKKLKKIAIERDWNIKYFSI